MGRWGIGRDSRGGRVVGTIVWDISPLLTLRVILPGVCRQVCHAGGGMQAQAGAAGARKVKRRGLQVHGSGGQQRGGAGLLGSGSGSSGSLRREGGLLNAYGRAGEAGE